MRATAEVALPNDQPRDDCLESVAAGLITMYRMRIRSRALDAERASAAGHGRAHKPADALKGTWAQSLRASPEHYAVALTLLECSRPGTRITHRRLHEKIAEAVFDASAPQPNAPGANTEYLVRSVIRELAALRPAAPAWVDVNLVNPLRDRGADYDAPPPDEVKDAKPVTRPLRSITDPRNTCWAPIRDDTPTMTAVRTLFRHLDRAQTQGPQGRVDPAALEAQVADTFQDGRDGRAIIMAILGKMRDIQPAKESWVEYNIVRPLGLALDPTGSDELANDHGVHHTIYAGGPDDLLIEDGVPLAVDVTAAMSAFRASEKASQSAGRTRDATVSRAARMWLEAIFPETTLVSSDPLRLNVLDHLRYAKESAAAGHATTDPLEDAALKASGLPPDHPDVAGLRRDIVGMLMDALGTDPRAENA